VSSNYDYFSILDGIYLGFLSGFWNPGSDTTE